MIIGVPSFNKKQILLSDEIFIVVYFFLIKLGNEPIIKGSFSQSGKHLNYFKQ